MLVEGRHQRTNLCDAVRGTLMVISCCRENLPSRVTFRPSTPRQHFLFDASDQPEHRQAAASRNLLRLPAGRRPDLIGAYLGGNAAVDSEFDSKNPLTLLQQTASESAQLSDVDQLLQLENLGKRSPLIPQTSSRSGTDATDFEAEVTG